MEALEAQHTRALYIVTKRVVELVAQDHSSDPVGAYLCVTDARGLVLMHAMFGKISDVYAHHCYRMARSNASIVSCGTPACHAGAVYCDTMAVSMYGLPDRLDQVGALSTAVLAGLRSEEQAKDLVRVFRIRRYDEFWNRVSLVIDP